MTEEFVLAYNGSGLNISSVVDYYRFLYSNQCTVFDNLLLQRLSELKNFVSTFKDSKDKIPRILFIFDVKDKDFTDIIKKINELGFNDYRVNYLLAHVTYDEEVLSKMSELNNLLVGKASFIYLIGSEDFEGNEITDEKLKELLFNYFFLIINGSFTHRTGQDPFFWQQNSRTSQNHLLVLNPIHFTTDLSGDLYQELLNEVICETQLWYKEKTNKKTSFFNNAYSQFVYSEDETIPPYAPFRQDIIPYNELLKDKADNNLLINTNNYLDSAKNAFIDFKTKIIDQYKEKLHNQKENEIKKLLEWGYENTADKYLNHKRFDISKLYIDLDEYIESSKTLLNKRFNDIPILETSEIQTSINSNYLPSLINLAERIKAWRSKKNKTRLFINGIIISGLIGIIMLYLIYHQLEIINLKNGIIISFSTSVIIVGFWSIQFYYRKLKQIIKQYKKKHNEIIDYVNQRIKYKFSEFEEGWFKLILEIYKKKVIKRFYFFLIKLKSKLQSFDEITAHWIIERKKLSEITEKSTYLCKFKEKREFNIKKEIESMLLDIRKDLSKHLKTFRKNDNFFIDVFQSFNSVFFENHKKILNNVYKQIRVSSTKTDEEFNNSIFSKVSGKINVNKIDRIPLGKKFLITAENTSPKVMHSFILKSKYGNFSNVSLQEGFDDIFELDGIEPNITIGYVFNITLEKIN